MHIGCSGWSYREWKGVFYPAALPQKEWFSYYAQHFSTVEINATFYRTPMPKTLQKWRDQAPERFVYILKAPKQITHVKRFVDCVADIQGFYELGKTLGDKLSGFLFQFPPSFTYDPDRLEMIIQSLDRNYRNIIEFRHTNWWQDEVIHALEKAGLIFCSVIAPALPNIIIASNGRIYVRLHGDRYKGSYGESFLQQFADKIKALNPEEVWVYFNNTMDVSAPFDALCLKKLFDC